MLTIYDVKIDLPISAKSTEMTKLKDHLKALSINSVGLDSTDYRPRTETLSFSIYGDVGPFMMKKMIMECAGNVFPGSFIDLSARP